MNRMGSLIGRAPLVGLMMLWAASIATADSQVGASPTPEASVVVRVSRELIDELTDNVVEAEIPFRVEIPQGRVTGVATGQAKTAVTMTSSDDQAAFTITATGEAVARFVAVRWPLRVEGCVRVPFVAEKTVHFDGIRFTAGPMRARACVIGAIHRVGARRPGPVKDAIGRLATPLVRVLIPKAERDAVPHAERYLAEFADREAEQVISELNQTTPLEESVARLYPDASNWVYRLSSETDHLQAILGPEGAVAPSLPTIAGRTGRTGLEVWVKTTPEEARFIELLARWNVVHDLLRKFIQESDPKVTGILEDATLDVVVPWVVIGIGKH